LRSGLSLAGVSIAVSAVVMLTAVGEGARRYVTGQFAELGTNLLVAFPGRTETTGGMPGLAGTPHDLTLDDARALQRSLPQIEHLAPVVMGTESVAHGERRRQMALIGSTRALLHVRKLRLARGEFLTADSGRADPVVVLGATAARELFPAGDAVGSLVRIGDARMRVVGVMARRGMQLGVDMDDVALVPVASAMRLLNRHSLFRVLIQVRAQADLEPVRRRVLALLAERHGEEDVTCLTQEAMVSAFSAVVQALTLALAAIAAVSLGVAGIGIMNVMLVSVSERTREVGLLKAVGAARRQVLWIFLAEALLLAGAGAIVGLAAGAGATALLVQVYPALPARPPLWAVESALALSLVVGAASGLWPARRATRLTPLAAMARRA
jgi:putative ABC transport system permease protein